MSSVRRLASIKAGLRGAESTCTSSARYREFSHKGPIGHE